MSKVSQAAEEEKKPKKNKNESPSPSAESQQAPRDLKMVAAQAKTAIDGVVDTIDKLKHGEDKIRKAELTRIKTSLGIKDGLMFADEYESVKEVFSTGNDELDRIITTEHYEITGKGGVPRGYLFEMFGPFGGGKSTLCLKIAADATRNKGYKVLWVDAESSYQPTWADAQGVDNSKLLRLGPGRTGEAFLEIIEKACLSKEFPLIIVDSLMGLQPKVVLETPLEENAKMCAMGTMTSKAMPRLVNACEKGFCTVVFINQIRYKPGVMYGDPETTPGGEALKFFASGRLRISPVSGKDKRLIMKNGDAIGVRSNVFTRKTRFSPPFQDCVVPIYFTNEKPHPLDQLIDMCLSSKIIKCKGGKVDGEDVQLFTLKDAGLMSLTIDAFRKKMDEDLATSCKVMLEQLRQKGAKIEQDVVEYVASLDGDAMLGIAPVAREPETI